MKKLNNPIKQYQLKCTWNANDDILSIIMKDQTDIQSGEKESQMLSANQDTNRNSPKRWTYDIKTIWQVWNIAKKTVGNWINYTFVTQQCCLYLTIFFSRKWMPTWNIRVDTFCLQKSSHFLRDFTQCKWMNIFIIRNNNISWFIVVFALTWFGELGASELHP